MKFLWIEDFGGGLAASKVVIDMFRDIIPEKVFDSEYDEDVDVCMELPRLFKKNSMHDITVGKSYMEWRDIYSDSGGDFDLVIVDINLENYKTPETEKPLKNRSFDKKAGFYIYHQLIKDGFPEDNIAFFTGEENSLKSFKKTCGEVMIDKPKNTFEKKKADFEKLRKWIGEKINTPYFTLRRGIIDGCRLLKKELKNIKDTDLDQKLIFFKTTPLNVFHSPKRYRLEFEDYLSKLETFFPLKPPTDKPHIYLLFLKEIVSKWEKSKGFFMWEKDVPKTTSRLEENFLKTCQFIMKQLRNWAAHEKLTANISENDVAYFFMLGMRSWIKLDIYKIYAFEKILSSVFVTSSFHDMNQIESVIERHLSDSFYDLLAEFSRKPDFGKQDNYFHSLVKEYGEAPEMYEGNLYGTLREEIRSRSLRLVYQSFWHGLFPSWINSRSYGNFMSVNFDIVEIPPGSFLLLLGQLIFHHSFGKAAEAHNIAMAPKK